MTITASSVVVTAGSTIYPSTTGEKDSHALRFKEVLICDIQQLVSSDWEREAYMVP